MNNINFLDACESGNLEEVRDCLCKFNVDIHYNNDEGLRVAATHGHLDIVRYLLTSSELKEHANIHAKSDIALRWACEGGHLDIVQYMLTSPELNHHADIVTPSNINGIEWAFKGAHLNVVSYLLFSPELHVRPDITRENYRCFKSCFLENNIEGLNYLLFDKNINLSVESELFCSLLQKFQRSFHTSYDVSYNKDVFVVFLDYVCQQRVPNVINTFLYDLLLKSDDADIIVVVLRYLYEIDITYIEHFEEKFLSCLMELDIAKYCDIVSHYSPKTSLLNQEVGLL